MSSASYLSISKVTRAQVIRIFIAIKKRAFCVVAAATAAEPWRRTTASGWLWLVLAAVGPLSSSAWASGVQSGVVTRVVDGDTVWVAVAGGGKPIKVRIEGIDAPEICQPGGTSSQQALRRRLLGSQVSLSMRLQDDYGRTLATIHQQGEDVGRWMVSSGHAWSYRYRGRARLYAEEEARARAARRGLFGQSDPEDPRSFRKRHGSCYP